MSKLKRRTVDKIKEGAFKERGKDNVFFKFLDINNAPTMTNLPLVSSQLVEENAALGSSVFQVSISDADSGQTHTYSATFSPGWASTYFTIGASGKLFNTTLIFHRVCIALSLSTTTSQYF